VNAESMSISNPGRPETLDVFMARALAVDALIGRPYRNSSGTVPCPTRGQPINWETSSSRIYVNCSTANCINYAGRYHGKPKPHRQFHQDSLL
jgi:hypothetical protein